MHLTARPRPRPRTIRLPVDVDARLDDYCASAGAVRNRVIALAVRSYLGEEGVPALRRARGGGLGVAGDLECGNGGPARGYSWPPFQPGHELSMKSGFWASPTLREHDRAEVEEIQASLRPLTPCYSPAFEPLLEQLSCRMWRQRRAYADLSEHGLIRDGKPAPVLAHLAVLESRIAKDLEALGMTPRSAAALGVDVVTTERTLSLIEYWRARELEDAEEPA